MPSCLRFALVLLLAGANSTAAQPTDFTPQQREVYENYRLSLKTRATSGYIARPIGATGDAYSITSFSTERWWGRRGSERVSEAEFYEFAGVPEIAAEVRRAKRGDLVSIGAGVGMFAGAFALSQIAQPEFTEDGTPNLALGGLISLTIGGAIFSLRGIQGYNDSKTHAWAAARAADQYNAVLIDEIRRAGPNAGAGGR